MSGYSFKICPNRIKGYFGQLKPLYEIRKPNNIMVFATSDEGQARYIYQLLCEAFNEGKKIEIENSASQEQIGMNLPVLPEGWFLFYISCYGDRWRGWSANIRDSATHTGREKQVEGKGKTPREAVLDAIDRI